MKTNNDWTKHTHFAALDWASDHHDVVIVDHFGAIAAEFRFAHTAAGWAEFTDKMKPYAGAPLALETSSGPAVDQLLQRGWTLYPVNPKAAERYRERKVPSGTKTDRHDGWSLAAALRTDGHGWRPLLPQDEATATLHTHRLWRTDTAPARLELFARANALPASAAVCNAKSLLAISLVKVLQALETQLQEYRRRITEAFAHHPDHDVFGSLPGAAEKIAPRLLGELGAVRAVYPDADALCCQAGVSPVSFQSGKLDKARIRWACDVVLRHTVHLWADGSRKKSAWAQAYYQGKRQQGHDHASALRCLGKRWLKVLWRLWQDGQKYDPTRHEQSLKAHGSWVQAHLDAALQATPTAR